MLWLTVHPSTPPQKGMWITPNNTRLTSRYSARGRHEDTTHFRGKVCVFGWMTERGGGLRGFTAWRETSGLKWKEGPENGKWLRALWLESIRQSSSWLGKRSQRGNPPPFPSFCLAAWNWDIWLHSDRINPNLVLIYTVHIIRFYNMTRKTSSKRDGVSSERRLVYCTDHSWQIASPQSDARVDVRFHYGITLRLFTSTTRSSQSEDRAHDWWRVWFSL